MRSAGVFDAGGMQEHRGRYSSMLSGDESGPNTGDTHGRLGYDSAQENGAAVDVENGR